MLVVLMIIGMYVLPMQYANSGVSQCCMYRVLDTFYIMNWIAQHTIQKFALRQCVYNGEGCVDRLTGVSTSANSGVCQYAV
jgi:hypothetical protein